MINEKYTSIPFVDGGRTLKGCDCFGLLKLVYENELNIIVPDTRIMPDSPRRIFANYLNEISINWEETKTPKKYDIIAMNLYMNHPKLITHFAIMIDEKRALHTLKKIGSHIVKLNDMRFEPFIKGFYRWRHL